MITKVDLELHDRHIRACRKAEKFEKAIEWLENASYNCDNVKKIGIALVPMIKEQIDNAIKNLTD